MAGAIGVQVSEKLTARTHIVRNVMDNSICICRRNRIVKNQKMVGKTFVESLMERMAGSNNPEKVRPILQFRK